MSGRNLFRLFNRHRYRQSYSKAEREDLSATIDVDIRIVEQKVRSTLGDASDVIYRQINFSKQQTLLIMYVDGLVDEKALNETFLKPLVFDDQSSSSNRKTSQGALEIVTNQLVPIANVKNVRTLGEITDGLLRANVAVVAHGAHVALLAELNGWPVRAIQESYSEPSIQGPHEAFNESLRNTTALIRRRLRDTRLRIESLVVGEFSKTDVSVMYLDGVVNESVLAELHLRLHKVCLDSVLDSHYIEEFLEDSPWSPFPQVQNTERPDVVTAALLDGKIAVVVDGTPTVLLVPMIFWDGFQAPDDYYQRALYVTLIRWVRFVMHYFSMFLTPTYVALISFHPQMLPTNLLITFAASHNGVPFPVVVEAFMMELIFEGLREAGIRLPKVMGTAVSIVGGIVVGQAAVEAGIVSAPTVIVVAISEISSFTIPRYNFGFSFRIIRFFMLICAGVLGLYGIALSFVIVLAHQVNLRSFGVPYMTPLAPRNSKQLLDVFLRLPRRLRGKKPHQDDPRLKSGST
ncbi:spore germination protein [Alicyclobacillus mengziensis]|uniref:Spore germination protein n=1 Tax=Alicyclobacillus mengziensis TaxID=2931921 RepID=A0A9X7W0P7_9BACL|nr:spore germination protein [Alicyclobacillus mengziensis]QSO48561.1 spore germination protein [Alicyclobacillus mengziensis]